MIKKNICPICVGVSSLWLGLSVGVAWGYLTASMFLIPIALLMGGTVTGIAYLGEKKWKTLVILTGMPTAYLLVTHLTKFIVVAELSALIIIAYFLFNRRLPKTASNIEKQMEQCC